MPVRVWRYDLEGVDLEDCCKVVLMPINLETVPVIMGALEVLNYRNRHVSDASHSVGIDLYQRLQEVFIVNECITDKLQLIVDALAPLVNLDCLCSASTIQKQQQSQILQEQVYYALEGNVNVDFSGTEDPNVGIGIPPSIPNSGRCKDAQAVWYNTNAIIRQTLDLQLGIAGVSSGALVALITALLVVPVPISIILGLVVGIAFVVVSEDVRSELDSWETLADVGICLIYNSVDMESASMAIHSLVDANVTNVAAQQYIKLFFGSVIMGQFWDSSSNRLTFDGTVCNDCNPATGDCYDIGACNLSEWNGGTVVCIDGFAQIRGGTSAWLSGEPIVPLGAAWITVSWIPRAQGVPVANCEFGVERISDGQFFFLGQTGDRPIGEIQIQSWALPNDVLGSDVRLLVKQWGFWCEPKWFCVVDTDPS